MEHLSTIRDSVKGLKPITEAEYRKLTERDWIGTKLIVVVPVGPFCTFPFTVLPVGTEVKVIRKLKGLGIEAVTCPNELCWVRPRFWGVPPHHLAWPEGMTA